MGAQANAIEVGYQRESTAGTAESAELLAKTTISALNADSSINDSVEDLSVFAAGTFIQTSGFSEAANNGNFKVVTSSANKLTVVAVDGSAASLTDDPVGDTVSIKSVTKRIRLTSCDLRSVQDRDRSEELVSDGQDVDDILLKSYVEGTLNGEFSCQTYDDMIRAAIRAAEWSAAVAVATADTDVAAVNATNKFTHAVAWDSTPSAGDLIKVSGFATAANNGVFKVVSADSTNIVVEGGTLTDEAATPAVTVSVMEVITNGTTDEDFTFEEKYSDLSSIFSRFLGNKIGMFSMEAAASGKATCSVTIRGMSEVSPSPTSSINKGTEIAVNTNRIVDTVRRITGIFEAGSGISLASFSFQIGKPLRDQDVIGTVGPSAIVANAFEISGSARLYMADQSLKNKFLADTRTRFAMVITDADGNVTAFDFPEVVIRSCTSTPPGKDQDIMVDIEWGAIKDATELKTVRVARA